VLGELGDLAVQGDFFAHPVGSSTSSTSAPSSARCRARTGCAGPRASRKCCGRADGSPASSSGRTTSAVRRSV
jgi:hypothetical protein